MGGLTRSRCLAARLPLARAALGRGPTLLIPFADTDLRNLHPGDRRPAFGVDAMNNGMTPERAIDEAFKQVEAILAKYPIQQA